MDATAGNGHDAVFLAGLVGDAGCVHVFDVQQQALQSAASRLQEHGLAHRTQLHCAGHETMAAIIPESLHGRIAAVTFNLGFLPGSDKQVTTQPETTLPALNAALDLVRPGGAVSVVCYAGHPGGEEETHAVAAWAAGLKHEKMIAGRYETVNKPGGAVCLFCVEKLL